MGKRRDRTGGKEGLGNRKREMGEVIHWDAYGVTRESRILISRSSRRSRIWMEIHWESRGSEGSIVMAINLILQV
jgi:hypothetical protein